MDQLSENIVLQDCKRDILKVDLIQNPPKDVDRLSELYISTVATLFDKHTPLKAKTIKIKPGAEWFDKEWSSAKLVRMQAERKPLKSRSHQDKEELRKAKQNYDHLLN